MVSTGESAMRELPRKFPTGLGSAIPRVKARPAA